VQPTQETLQANQSSTDDGSCTETDEYCRSSECRMDWYDFSDVVGICGMVSLSNLACFLTLLWLAKYFF